MIYTFYSYKGGVGRTHALANLAAYLCYYQKRRVLLIDWDLEAPGLHFYFGKTSDEIVSLGLIDVLEQHIAMLRNAEAGTTLTENDFFNPFAAEAADYTQTLIEAPNGGSIALMPATRYVEGYRTKIEGFDWIKFYDDLYGGSYLLWLRQQLKKRYDYVFIDSRTGFNDYSGICNVLMPDMNLIFVAPNTQNFEGSKAMANRIIESAYTQSQGRKPFILPILSRLDASDERADEWREKFAEAFGFLVPLLDRDLRAFGKEVLELLSAKTILLYNRSFAIGERIHFKAEAPPLVAGSFLENYQNIALDFLEVMNQHGEIDLNKLVDDKMIPVYMRQIRENPANAEAHFGLGLAYYNLGRLEQAVKHYRSAIEAQPDYAYAYNNLGSALSHQGEYAQAVQAYQKAIELQPDYATAYYNLGNALDDQGEYAQAVQAYQKAIELQPDDAKVYYHLGNAFYHQGEYAQAVQAYQKAIELQPDDATAYYNLGLALRHQGEYAQAVQAYQKAIELQPDYATAYFNLGNALADQGNYAQAVQAYQKAIELQPDYATAYYNLGNALDDQGEYAQAVQAYQKAINLQPDYANAYNNLGNALRHQGEYAQAVQACQKAIELQPDDADAYNNLGNALSRQGEYAQAVQAYQQAIELQPDFAAAYNGLGCTYLAQGQLQQAQATYEQAFQINENHEVLHMNYAHCLLAQKQPEQAMHHYRRSREGFGDKTKFFQDLVSDYTDFRLGQYGMEEKAYFAVIEELKDEIKYIE